MTAELSDGREVEIEYTGKHLGYNYVPDWGREDLGYEVNIESVVDIESEYQIIHELAAEEFERLHNIAYEDYIKTI